jgi:hypothetical protein
MTSAEEQPKFLAQGPEKIRAATGAMVRASLSRKPEEERAVFHVLLGHLEDLAHAIGQLPPAPTRHEPGIPWRELCRLPGLLSRSDVRADAMVIRRTLEWPMHHLRPAALRLYDYTGLHPRWATEEQEAPGSGED